MISIVDIDRYLKVNKYWYRVWSYNALLGKNDYFEIVDNSNNSVLHLCPDKNTGQLYTEVWNRPPNPSHLFKYKRVLSIKFDEDICNIFLLEGFKK